MELVGILSKGGARPFPQNSQSFHRTSGATDRQSGGKLAIPERLVAKWLDFVAHPSPS